MKSIQIRDPYSLFCSGGCFVSFSLSFCGTEFDRLLTLGELGGEITLPLRDKEGRSGATGFGCKFVSNRDETMDFTYKKNFLSAKIKR